MIEPTFTIKPDVEKPGYGRFSIEPLQKGYGQTLGNSLRRVLLTSLEGAALTSVRIEGIHHQFTTIPGLKEDVVEFLLNLKKVRLTLEGDETAHMTLSKKGPGEILAGDIQTTAGVTIVNPERVLGTLADSKSQIEMELFAQKGLGYVPVGETSLEEHGTIPLDALYSPIQRVNYKVEATRVGRMTNLDKLVIEIWTDGTISPLDALKSSSKILVRYFSQVYDPKQVEEKKEEEVSDGISEEVLKTRIEELDVPTRIVNALSKGGYDTIGQLLDAPRADVMKVKNLGSKSLSIVEDKLREKDVTLPTDSQE
ncbi:DNA-directed RNA polymerase subunit alpha [Patescibacteria group bacterium]